VDYSVRYWRIVVGWWLFYFTQVAFDRWQVIREADNAYPNARMMTLPTVEEFPASTDMHNFINACQTDTWNERLFGELARQWTRITCITLSQDVGQGNDSANPNIPYDVAKQSFKRRLTTRVAQWANRAGMIGFACGYRVSLQSEYLSRFERIKLLIILRQIPLMNPSIDLPTFTANPKMRRWILEGLNDEDDEFVSALTALIPKYLPTVYLEGYSRVSMLAKNSGHVRRPRVLMTATAFESDDRWKMFAAECCESGSKLVVAQHGGHYGSGAYNASQSHEIAISDRFLSWGWSDPNEPKVFPAPATKLIGIKKLKPKADGLCLQVTTSLPMQSYWLYSVPIGPQVSGLIDDQFRFVDSLSSQVRQNLVVRLAPKKYGWDEQNRWRETEPQIQLDMGKSPIQNLLHETRLYVATYNATTFLESITQGIPTVMFWNPRFWEPSDSAIPYFDALREASILFDDPFACATHVNSIWDDVWTWWDSIEVESALQPFMRQFGYVGSEPIRELKAALTQW